MKKYYLLIIVIFICCTLSAQGYLGINLGIKGNALFPFYPKNYISDEPAEYEVSNNGYGVTLELEFEYVDAYKRGEIGISVSYLHWSQNIKKAEKTFDNISVSIIPILLELKFHFTTKETESFSILDGLYAYPIIGIDFASYLQKDASYAKNQFGFCIGIGIGYEISLSKNVKFDINGRVNLSGHNIMDLLNLMPQKSFVYFDIGTGIKIKLN